MASSYIPARDADFDAWSSNFATVIAANPSAYGLAAADATAITNAYTLWSAAYTLATNPSTRTTPSIAAKDVQKAASLVTFRAYATIIQANQGVSNDAKADAGLTIRSAGRTPVPAPATAPILGFVGATPLVHTLTYRDTSTPTSKAKPFGALQLEIWRSVGLTAPSGPETTSFVGLYTKSPLAVNFISADVGKTAWYYGRWVTRRGLVGPWSALLSAAIV